MSNKLTSLTGFGEGDPKPESKDGMSGRKRAGMKSYHTHAKHNPKTGYLELSKDAPKRAHNYYNKLGSSPKSAALNKKMGRGMSHHQKMEAKGMRYQAAKMPENYTSMSQADRSAYYKKNKGSYVSNEVDSKTGKYKNTY